MTPYRSKEKKFESLLNYSCFQTAEVGKDKVNAIKETVSRRSWTMSQFFQQGKGLGPLKCFTNISMLPTRITKLFLF